MTAEPLEWVPAVVFGRLTDSTIRLVLFPGNGFADGGISRDAPLAMVPADLRMPNTAVKVAFSDGFRTILAVKKRDAAG